MLLILLTAALAVALIGPYVRIALKRRRWVEPNPNDWSYRHKPRYSEAGWTTFVAAMFGPIVIFIVLLIVTSAAGAQTVTGSSRLVALNTGQSVEGRFFLGTGTVDSEAVIRYVVLADDGAALLTEAPARQARIYQDEKEAPRVDYGSAVLDNPWIAPFPLSLGTRRAYYFHVPAGSVLESYEVTP